MISYKDNIQVTSTTTGTDTLTQAAAVTGFAAPAAGDDGKTFTIMIKLVDASGIPTGEWELCESTYTHSGTTWSRGTLIDSSTGSRVTFSAGTKHIAVVAPARVFGAAGGGLEISNQTVTTTDITGAVGNMYICTIAGLTANRNLTLPSAAVGERIGVHVVDGDDTYALILKGASGQTINGGSAATEWSRVFIKGETVIFKCIAANTWIVESDGRIPCVAKIRLTATSQSVSAATQTEWKDFDSNGVSEVFDVGNIMDGTTGSSGGRVTIRRSSDYNIFGALASGDALSNGEAIYMRIMSDPSGSATILLYEYRTVAVPPMYQTRFNTSGTFRLTAGEVVVYAAYRSVSGTFAGFDSATSWGVQEILG